MTMTEICNTRFLGEEALLANNGLLEMTIVPRWGGRIIALRHLEKEAHLLRMPSSLAAYRENPILYGIPILFPPNRIADGTFTYQGRSYQFPINEPEKNNHIHGFVHDQPWQVTAARTEGAKAIVEVLYDSANDPEISRWFPHPFRLKMTYTLKGNTLWKEATVENRGTEAFPWGLGFHTTFLFPPTGLFSLSVEKRWKLNERNLPTGELEPLDGEPWREGLSLKDRPLDDAFLATPGKEGYNEAKLWDPERKIQVIYRCDENFKHWVVYNADSRQGFLCPEPYTWVTNAPNLDLPPERTGLRELAPGEKKTLRTEIICQ